MNIKLFDGDSFLYELLLTLRNQFEISLRNQFPLMKVALPLANNILSSLMVTTAAYFGYRCRNSGKYRSGQTPVIANKKKWIIEWILKAFKILAYY